jgi:hypothetical protein
MTDFELSNALMNQSSSLTKEIERLAGLVFTLTMTKAVIEYTRSKSSYHAGALASVLGSINMASTLLERASVDIRAAAEFIAIGGR